MKKLTKRVQAGGLWFDVPRGTIYVTIDAVGYIQSHNSMPQYDDDSWDCYEAGAYSEALGFADLEGADWRECCWYVGDQVDGESVERREWMARGADAVVEALSKSDAFTFGDCVVVTATHAAKIRNGEVE